MRLVVVVLVAVLLKIQLKLISIFVERLILAPKMFVRMTFYLKLVR